MENNPDKSFIQKKRGRKPKGGKISDKVIITQLKPNIPPPTKDEPHLYLNEKISQPLEQTFTKPNIILHLKCFKSDLEKEDMDLFGYGTANPSMLPYNSINSIDEENIKLITHNHNSSFVTFKDQNEADIIPQKTHVITPLCSNTTTTTSDQKQNCLKKKELKELNSKLKLLEFNLHINHVTKHNSACFWCTFPFDTTPIHIPKTHHKNGIIDVYGWFCSPECAAGFLMNETLDSSTKFERYSLLHYLYSSIYEYKTSITPAANPLYLLDKFMGNLTIDEYRNLSNTKKHLVKIDKPMTQILPEYHEDGEDFILTSKLVSTSTNNNANTNSNIQIQSIQQNKKSKSSSLNDHFYKQ